MEPAILFRNNPDIQDEVEAAQKYLPVLFSRSLCSDKLIVGRYSCLPFYKELEEDLKYNNCRLINTYKQHRWIANFEYYEQLKDYTPETWSADEWYKCTYDGPFVLKGRTNSRKHQWSTRMFAANRDVANEIATELYADTMIGEQDILFRKYVPLKTFEYGIGGMPFANEWRFFYLGARRLSYGYYWSIADDIESPVITEEGLDLADEVARIAAKHANFFVVDVAEKQDGGWVVIELNDGQMSGLSENNPDLLYSNLSLALKC